MKDLEALLTAEVAYVESAAEFEIGGEIVSLYAKPMTGTDISAIQRRHPQFTSNPTPEAMIDMIIRKARDESGNPAFTLKHKPLLQRVKVEKIGKLFADLFGNQLDDDTEERAEERKKN